MVEKCLMAASLAVLVFHPSSTIKCFRPKSSTTSPPREKPPTKSPHNSYLKKFQSKSKNKQDFRTDSLHPNIPSSPPPPSLPIISRTAKDIDLVSELVEGDPSIGIVKTIFKSGWASTGNFSIEKVFKVNHSIEILTKFEEYREKVKSKSANTNDVKKMERLLVDGNEVLKFHGAIITCSLGMSEFNPRTCGKKCCGVCRMMNPSFWAREESVSLFVNSLKAHERVAAECGFLGISARKGIIICRVVAGRIARCNAKGMVDGEVDGGDGGGFDSVVNWTRDQSDGSEELMVLNSRAVLPCFVVIYNVN